MRCCYASTRLSSSLRKGVAAWMLCGVEVSAAGADEMEKGEQPADGVAKLSSLRQS